MTLPVPAFTRPAWMPAAALVSEIAAFHPVATSVAVICPPAVTVTVPAWVWTPSSTIALASVTLM